MMFNFIKQICSDSKGNPSSLRVAFLGVCFLMFGVWAYLCVLKLEWIPFGVPNLSVLILFSADKLGQKSLEGKDKD